MVKKVVFFCHFLTLCIESGKTIVFGPFIWHEKKIGKTVKYMNSLTPHKHLVTYKQVQTIKTHALLSCVRCREKEGFI